MRGTGAVRRCLVLGAIGAVLAGACSVAIPEAPADAPTDTPVGAVAAATSGPTLQLVVIGDSIASPEPCSGCTTFVEQYADHLAAATGRPVDVVNRSHTDDTRIADIHDQVLGEERLRDEVAAADVIILSVGSSDVLPDPYAVGGCEGDVGATAESWVDWALATTPQCRDAARLAHAARYDALLTAITELRGQTPTKAIALNAYDAHLGDPDFLVADVDAATLDDLWAWMTAEFDDWNRMQCARAISHFFDCVDLYHAFNGPAGDRPGGDLLIDGAHPSQAGNDLIAALLAELDLSILQVD
jgi:lysophospholipase L1-like esterase